MGGFMEYEGNRPIRVLLPEELESYSLTGNGDFPRISTSEIADRSKGDAISKGLVVLQTSWFVTQCIARGVQGLPITELELVTVAFAALNFMTYVLWWHKPLNVQRGARVYKKRPTDSEELVGDGDAEDSVGFLDALRGALLDARLAKGSVTAWMPAWSLQVVRLPLLRYSVRNRHGGGNYDNADDHHDLKMVNTFYPVKWAVGSEASSLFLLGTITVVFGAIHSTGWFFAFPSSIERTIWRVASLSITGVPIVIFPVWLLTSVVDRYLGDHNTLCTGIATSSLFQLYSYCRIVLLILPLLSLRSLPPAAFHIIHSFIPHV
jgi:hypothetical protein